VVGWLCLSKNGLELIDLVLLPLMDALRDPDQVPEGGREGGGGGDLIACYRRMEKQAHESAPLIFLKSPPFFSCLHPSLPPSFPT